MLLSAADYSLGLRMMDVREAEAYPSTTPGETPIASDVRSDSPNHALSLSLAP